MKIPGIGPINATLLLSHVGDAKHFTSGRHFSAYLGLVPRQYASGGKEQLWGSANMATAMCASSWYTERARPTGH